MYYKSWLKMILWGSAVSVVHQTVSSIIILSTHVKQ